MAVILLAREHKQVARCTNNFNIFYLKWLKLSREGAGPLGCLLHRSKCNTKRKLFFMMKENLGFELGNQMTDVETKMWLLY